MRVETSWWEAPSPRQGEFQSRGGAYLSRDSLEEIYELLEGGFLDDDVDFNKELDDVTSTKENDDKRK